MTLCLELLHLAFVLVVQVLDLLSFGGFQALNLLQMLLTNVLNDLLVLLFQQFQVLIDFKHCLAIVSALLYQNHLLFQITLHQLVLNRALFTLKLGLAAL